MMDVYIVYGSYAYEGGDVLASFDSKESAIEYVIKKTDYDFYEIHICKVNNEAEGLMEYNGDHWSKFRSIKRIKV